ncbi:Cytochrome P450 87A3 [Hordeum vulgare]|nr:Cytochrome P450 87A3 [Hordeum vulgare]
MQLCPFRRLRLLCCGFLYRYLCLDLVKEGGGLRLPLPDEPTVGLHLGLIPDGIQDGLLLRHFVGLGDGELLLRLRHVEARSVVVLLRFRRVRSETHNDAGVAPRLDLRLDPHPAPV